ncbi:hypothetical protein NLU13_2776 [Sarocladium strictum]|uniref:Uncharacterized protein n=1 Tax=Sarocladium strictum TaxID=5046 RepID=A0AA39GLI0_SARSR|nr:hypothetical protein NLU13_2776 [Sarocladium strictum]
MACFMSSRWPGSMSPKDSNSDHASKLFEINVFRTLAAPMTPSQGLLNCWLVFNARIDFETPGQQPTIKAKASLAVTCPNPASHPHSHSTRLGNHIRDVPGTASLLVCVPEAAARTRPPLSYTSFATTLRTPRRLGVTEPNQ